MIPVTDRQDDTAIRRRRRWRFLLWSLPVVIVVAVLALKLMGLSITNQTALNFFETGRYESSAETSTSLLEGNIIEPYIPWFNRGNAYAAQEKYTDAIDDLERALALAPDNRQCAVRVNLALSWELLGDIYLSGGYYQGAIQLYEAAAAVIAGGTDCVPPDKAGEDLQIAEERVQEKIEAAERMREAQEQFGGTEAGPGGQEEQLEELGELGQQGAQEKADEDAAERGENSGPPGSADKPW